MRDTFDVELLEHEGEGRVDIGRVAALGYLYRRRVPGTYNIISGARAATAFLFKLMSLLQFSGAVPIIDLKTYAKWLTRQEANWTQWKNSMTVLAESAVS